MHRLVCLGCKEPEAIDYPGLDKYCVACFNKRMPTLTKTEVDAYIHACRRFFDNHKTIWERLRDLQKVPIYLDFTFTITFVALIGFTLVSGGWIQATYTALAIFGLFASVLLHEFGHVLMAHYYGINVSQVRVFPIGAGAFLETLPTNPKDECFLAVAGPIVNGLLTLIFIPMLMLSLINGWIGLVKMFSFLVGVNVLLGVFNLLPVFPMDGGRILRSLLWFKTGDAIKATQQATFVASVGGWLFIIWGVSSFHFLTAIIGIFILIASKAELKQLEQNSIPGGWLN